MKVTYLNFHPALSNVDANKHSLLWKIRWLIKWELKSSISQHYCGILLVKTILRSKFSPSSTFFFTLFRGLQQKLHFNIVNFFITCHIFTLLFLWLLNFHQYINKEPFNYSCFLKYHNCYFTLFSNTTIRLWLLCIRAEGAGLTQSSMAK